MSPLELLVLLHHHCSFSAFSPSSEVADRTVAMFVKEGLLEAVRGFYTTTEKGRFYVQAILSLPFPIATFTIPTVKPKATSD